ncbi:MAG TPA: NAD(+)/NADH kinase [Acidimicrobiia bacterium]|jgi:NAD+ kinase|nr:NAD(+)/NADH kinase [Acidimicrobiia bacterium]HIL46825.1 NAD(+)/NADH kinase [Acidimicrobiia bacterium]
MAAVGLVVHEHRSEAIIQAADLAGWLTKQGHEVRHPLSSETITGLDLIVSLGGDGSILRAVDLLDGAPVPVLGVNFGHLGYLTACEPGEVQQAVSKVLAGDCRLEDRMMLRVEVRRADGTVVAVDHALNEVVVERHGPTIRVGVALDGEFFTSYVADGLIVASPTGSTAYAFSAQGPIVDATHRSLQVTPVSAHMLFDRTMVLAPSTEVCLEVLGDRPAICNVDGREQAVVSEGDQVVVTAADRVARLVTFGQHHFARVLKTKFGLEDR